MPSDLEKERADEAQDRAFFRSIPWTARLLDDPDFEYLPTMTRQFKPNGLHSFFGDTLKTPTTIPHVVMQYRKLAEPNTFVQEIRLLVHVGNGLNGWPNVLHGGVVSALLDEALSTVLHTNMRVPGAKIAGESGVTVELKIRFKEAMSASSVLCVTGRFKDIQGRKCFTEGDVMDERGNVLASGEAMFIVSMGDYKQKKPKL